jgi:beta-lactamase regulating signal transducer with metallopeptidase domain
MLTFISNVFLFAYESEKRRDFLKKEKKQRHREEIMILDDLSIKWKKTLIIGTTIFYVSSVGLSFLTFNKSKTI